MQHATTLVHGRSTGGGAMRREERGVVEGGRGYLEGRGGSRLTT